jgi:Zn-dependent M28 family amino/carboxypeptidase
MKTLSVLLLTVVPLGASLAAAPPTPADPARIRAHVAFLADDLLEGRGPGTRGGKLAENYIAAAFAQMGVAPAGQDGTYFQKVPLVGVKTQPSSSLTLRGAGGSVSPKLLEEMVLFTHAQKESLDVDADVVFVGYGIEAPEYRWDDFKGVDVTGKVVVMLVNDPPATATEPDLFKGKALTYYGRWTYKLESATRHHAKGAILLHTDDSAGYGWDVVKNSWSGEQSQNVLSGGETPLVMAGWISDPTARKVAALSGMDVDALRKAAASRDFRPVPMKIKAQAHLDSALRHFDARNVIGKIPGRDPKLADEAVLFGAHADHLGIGAPDETGDTIYNGAVDDASGVASMLEVARTVAADGGWPRAAWFLAVTAEEQGLKGSEWFAAHPLLAPAKMAAYVNLDGGKPWGEVDDMVLMGAERSPELDRIARDVATELKFTIKPDLHPEKGYFYRSDHFSFAKIGVPCVNIEMGETLRGKPKGAGETLEEEYRTKRYHRPADQLDDRWDARGLAEYATTAREIGRRVAGLPAGPTWKPGDEFEAARKRSVAR